MSKDSLLGNKYGKWTIIDDSGLRKPKKKKGSYRVVKCQCECGTIKISPRSPFLYGSNSEKCFSCYNKIKRIGCLAYRYLQ